MKNRALVVCLLISFTQVSLAAKRYGETLCKEPDYKCLKVGRGQSLERLFPDAEQRDIVRRVNRMNTSPWPGMVIAVPKRLGEITIYDVSPFPRYIDTPDGEKTIYVSQKKLAWGAYDQQGELVWWGPVSPGKSGSCPDVPGGDCKTPTGSFRIIRKQGEECISTVFPKPDGGAPMPYCMHFFQGYALHGAPVVPGYADSHGCIRLFVEDARWLNEEFVDTQDTSHKGTIVIVEGS